jgi:hypothetical protein
MNPAEQYLKEVRCRHTEAIVAIHVGELFHRLPMLGGFWLRPDFEVEGISLTEPGAAARRDLYDKVMLWLIELAEERPEAVNLMRGRTFARVLH